MSPLASDDYAEYRDAAFLERIGAGHLAPALAGFWPRRGPQWDALGLTVAGPVLVEAKAHLAEFQSPPSKAGPASRRRIDAAFSAMRADLGMTGGADWAERYFQYANRLAHLWFLRRHGVAATLLFVSFLNDGDMAGPEDAETWEAAFAAADRSLGLTGVHPLFRHVRHVTPDVRRLGGAPAP